MITSSEECVSWIKSTFFYIRCGCSLPTSPLPAVTVAELTNRVRKNPAKYGFAHVESAEDLDRCLRDQAGS